MSVWSPKNCLETPYLGATRSTSKVSHYWRWEQKNEENNNAASHKNNRSAGYRRPIKKEV